MIKCSLCGSELQAFSICPTCGKGFCPRHGNDLCPFCRVPRTTAVVSTERRYGSYEIVWVDAAGARVGLVGFEEVPREVPEILKSLTENRPTIPFEVIVFPDKNLSNEFRKIVVSLTPFAGFKMKDPPQESRFSTIYAPKRGPSTVLINRHALE